MSTHLNELRGKRDAAMQVALEALVSRFTIATPRYAQQLFDTVARVPISEHAAALRHVYAPGLPKEARRAVFRFLIYSRKVWELESEATPMPVQHRGCPND